MIQIDPVVTFPADDTQYVTTGEVPKPEQIARDLHKGTDVFLYVTIQIPGLYDELMHDDWPVTLVAKSVSGDVVKCSILSVDDRPCPGGTELEFVWDASGNHKVRDDLWDLTHHAA